MGILSLIFPPPAETHHSQGIEKMFKQNWKYFSYSPWNSHRGTAPTRVRKAPGNFANPWLQLHASGKDDRWWARSQDNRNEGHALDQVSLPRNGKTGGFGQQRMFSHKPMTESMREGGPPRAAPRIVISPRCSSPWRRRSA